MARNFVVYQSRNRLTGTLMRTLDLRHTDAPAALVKESQKQMAGARYAAQCVEHNKVALFEEHYPAGRAIAHPDEWCTGCQAHLAAKKDKVTEATSEAYMKAFRAEERAKDEKAQARKAAREAKKSTKAPVDEAPSLPVKEESGEPVAV